MGKFGALAWCRYGAAFPLWKFVFDGRSLYFLSGGAIWPIRRGSR
jgi:hypothetical protein